MTRIYCSLEGWTEHFVVGIFDSSLFQLQPWRGTHRVFGGSDATLLLASEWHLAPTILQFGFGMSGDSLVSN